MIIDINGKNVVLGMEWETLFTRDGKNDANRKASTLGSSHLWYEENQHAVGFLGAQDRRLKFTSSIYAGAMMVANAGREYPNVLAVFEVRDGLYWVVGIQNNKPRKDLDVLVKEISEVEKLRSTFGTLCKEIGYVTIGDIDLPDIKIVELATLSVYADSFTELHKTHKVLPQSLKLGLFAVALGAIGYLGYDYNHQRKVEEARRKAIEDQQGVQLRYDDILRTKRSQAAIPNSQVKEFVMWVRQFPTQIGGWYLDEISCAAGNPTRCTFNFIKSPYRAATYGTFYQSAGNQFSSVAIDKKGDAIQAIIANDKLKTVTIGDAIDSAIDFDKAINQGGSQLQMIANKMPFVNKNGASQLEFEDYELPKGTLRKRLTKKPIQHNAWKIEIPLSQAVMFDPLPPYIVSTQLNVKVSTTPSSDKDKSFAMLTISGSMFAKD